MRDPVPQSVRLVDYAPPAFLVPEVELEFDILAEFTRVKATLTLRRNPAALMSKRAVKKLME